MLMPGRLTGWERMSQKTAFITGITGQDGSYLAELLLAKGYRVHGLVRRSSSSNTARIQHLLDAGAEADGLLTLHHGDMTDTTALTRMVEEIRPDEIYNLAAQSHVAVSFDSADYTANVDALGTLRLLEALRTAGLIKTCRFYQASTSELYGLVQETPQRETTPVLSAQPLRGRQALRLLDRAELPRGARAARLQRHPVQSREPAPRRDVRDPQDHPGGRPHRARVAPAACSSAISMPAAIGAMRRDFVEGMHLILQQPKPDDYVLATGETHTVREFVELAFGHIGRTIKWSGKGEAEKGLDAKTGEVLVEVDPKFYRPAEVQFLLGDPSKAKRDLGWTPKTPFAALVEEMVKADVARND